MGAHRNWSIQDAKNRFSEVVEAAQRRLQMVTKHGKPAVVVVAADEYQRLQKLQHLKAPSFAELLLAMPADGQEFERPKGECGNLVSDVPARHRRPFGVPQTATATRSQSRPVEGRSGLDLAIAATALEHGLTVVTRNVSDFEPAGVPVVNPFDRPSRSYRSK